MPLLVGAMTLGGIILCRRTQVCPGDCTYYNPTSPKRMMVHLSQVSRALGPSEPTPQDGLGGPARSVDILTVHSFQKTASNYFQAKVASHVLVRVLGGTQRCCARVSRPRLLSTAGLPAPGPIGDRAGDLRWLDDDHGELWLGEYVYFDPVSEIVSRTPPATKIDEFRRPGQARAIHSFRCATQISIRMPTGKSTRTSVASSSIARRANRIVQAFAERSADRVLCANRLAKIDSRCTNSSSSTFLDFESAKDLAGVDQALSLIPSTAVGAVLGDSKQRARRGLNPMVSTNGRYCSCEDGPFLVGRMDLCEVHQSDRVIGVVDGWHQIV